MCRKRRSWPKAGAERLHFGTKVGDGGQILGNPVSLENSVGFRP
jgi:hypothetical protein